MTLPELAHQIVYARLAWGIVLAALLVAVLKRRTSISMLGVGGVLLASIAAMALPGGASPAFWLVLAFQVPSTMLLFCCALFLWRCASALHPQDFISQPWAAGLAALGGLLYLDSMGWLTLEVYALGFDPHWAPAAAVALGLAALWALRFQVHGHSAIALLGCVALFSLLRLPSGNLLDALLDPMLWLWASVHTARAGWRRVRGARARAGNAPA